MREPTTSRSTRSLSAASALLGNRCSAVASTPSSDSSSPAHTRGLRPGPRPVVGPGRCALRKRDDVQRADPRPEAVRESARRGERRAALAQVVAADADRREPRVVSNASGSADASSRHHRGPDPHPVRSVSRNPGAQSRSVQPTELCGIGDLLDSADDDDAPTGLASRLVTVDLEHGSLRVRQRMELRPPSRAEDHRLGGLIEDVVDRADQRRPVRHVDRQTS
jgi:hypothetical protein